MTKDIELDDSFIRLSEELPRRDERVIVVCQNYRCYGYLDKKGVWRSHYSDDALDDVIGWAP